MTLASRQLRADVREAFGCDCAGAVQRIPGRGGSRRVQALRSELDGIEKLMGHRPTGCPWRAFEDPEVGHVIRAYDFFESGQLEFYCGPDPAWRLVQGLQHYHRALGIARADVRKLRKAARKPPTPPPKGAQVRGVTRG